VRESQALRGKLSEQPRLAGAARFDRFYVKDGLIVNFFACGKSISGGGYRNNMEEKSGHYGKKILVLAFSVLLVLTPVAAGEFYCRYFTRINFLDNSSGLFTARRFGNSYGNTPDFTGVSFGTKFWTDSEGLRIDPAVSPEPEKVGGSGAILVVGDSVVFGPALEASETIPGRLQSMMPDRRVMNAGVIGYDTADYLNETRYFIERYPDIESVVLFICLNDVNDQSAAEIRRSVERSIDTQPSRNPVRMVNDFLRSRSKLYLWFKNAVTDTQKTYFDFDAAFYDRGENFVAAAMQPVSDLNKYLNTRNKSLRVYLLPYEYQLRPEAGPEAKKPQQLITEVLRKSGVEVRDLTTDFAASGIEPRELFLFGDPMHLSSAGTLLAAKSVCPDLTGCRFQQ